MTMRRVEASHPYHQRLHVFSDGLETAMTAILLVLLGGMMPALWPYLDWRHAVIGFGLILVIRPLAGLLGLLGTALEPRERAVVAFYGVRGIGSIYYLGYASTHVTFIDQNELWALVSFTIFASTVVHGLTAGESVRLLVREPRE
ncbi:Na+/H+ antiporter, CPA1 family protein [Rubellimicrobium mesophilum DSM 19309]|uniref:Na+/H+ antiporter, CPA1 family protein n=2 Tax=Rubellimicrobium TaxID=295418 RepID=A0A017HAY2_9RHOB|nr:Na+/H+ antiporter, CPA1 family protein [Rubellimicrobium mesophilum DSM 19309]